MKRILFLVAIYSYYNQQVDDYLDIYKDTPLIQIIEKIVFAE